MKRIARDSYNKEMRLLLLLIALFSFPAHAEFGAHLASHFEFGSMGGEAADVYESRSMGAFGLQAMPGYRLMGKALLAGLMFDLRFFSQLSGGTSVGFGGKSLLIGPAVAYELNMVKMLLGWDLRARHSTTTPMTTYKGSGLRLLLGYRLGGKGNVWGELQYLKTTYKMRTVSGEDTDISESPISSSMVGFGISISY